MHCIVKLLILACLVGYFDKVYSSLERWLEFEESYVETITGVVLDKRGNHCTYFENRLRKKSGPRLLELKCRAPNSRNVLYSCDFKGNPHNCKWYNKHQPKFYANMAKELGKVLDGACNVTQIESNDCGGIIFRLQ